MTGSDADWEKMTNKDMHDKFATLVMANMEDVDKRLGEALGTMLDSKFNELLARLPPPPPVPPPRPGYVGRAQRVSLEAGQNSGVAANAADNYDYYEGEDENKGAGGRHQAAGRPRPHIRNAHAAPRPLW